MKNLFLTIIAIMVLLSSCVNERTYTIQGNWKNAEGKVVYLKEKIGKKEYTIVDSAVVKSGKFKMVGKLPEIVERTVFIEKNHELVILDSVPININVESIVKKIRDKEIKRLKITLKGSINQELFKKYLEIKKAEMFMMLGVSMAGKKAKETNDNSMLDSIAKMYLKTKKNTKIKTLKLVKDNLDTYFAAIITNSDIAKSQKFDVTKEIYNQLSNRVKASSVGKTLKKTIDRIEKTAIGSIAPDFTLPTLDGKKITLSSLKGKYVIIDFWASWCGPCCRELPTVKRIYDKYKDKGLEIIGLSLDDKKERWTKAIEKYEMTWIQASDLKGWECPVAGLYNVTGIPKVFLLDKEGKIMSSTLRGEELEKEMDKIFEKQ